jgi:hypothetical protein
LPGSDVSDLKSYQLTVYWVPSKDKRSLSSDLGIDFQISLLSIDINKFNPLVTNFLLYIALVMGVYQKGVPDALPQILLA